MLRHRGNVGHFHNRLGLVDHIADSLLRGQLVNGVEGLMSLVVLRVATIHC